MKRFEIELVEPRVMMSVAPIASQNPPPIIWKNYGDADKPRVTRPRVPTPPPVSSPVEPPAPVAPPISAIIAPSRPTGLRARPCPRQNAIALCWKKVDHRADTVVVQASTDGENFVILAMTDAKDRKFCVTDLDTTKTYTFRVYALIGSAGSAYSDEVTTDWGK